MCTRTVRIVFDFINMELYIALLLLGWVCVADQVMVELRSSQVTVTKGCDSVPRTTITAANLFVLNGSWLNNALLLLCW